MTVASIRFNNPGAMWGSTLAKKWGATEAVVLHDGLGQGNNIANFPTPVQGACAQFDLWRVSYCNMSLAAAVKKWSGGNSSVSYMVWLEKETGLTSASEVTSEMLSSPQGVQLLKAQAHWEAGGVYPLSDAEWEEAQRKVFSALPPAPLPNLPPSPPHHSKPLPSSQTADAAFDQAAKNAEKDT